MNAIINILPTWIVAGLLFGLLWAISLVGAKWRRHLGMGAETVYATSAAVSLLALLIGFTFSLALSQYDKRRALVVEEASTIYSTWERSRLEPSPAGAEMGMLMRRYAEQRLLYFSHDIDADRQLRADHAADEITVRMWTIVRGLWADGQQSAVTAMMMERLAALDDVAWRREATGRDHIPPVVVDLLAIFSLMTAMSMGYSGAPDRRLHPTHLIFFVLNAAAIMLLLDLDRPRTGLIRVSQSAMMEAQALMADEGPKSRVGNSDGAPGGTRR